MSWLVAAAFVTAVGLLWSGVRSRVDPVVADRLLRIASPATRSDRPGRLRFPDLLRGRRAAAVRAESSARVPELLDLISVSVGAGVSPRLALERSPEAIGGSIARELEWARRRVTLGESWTDALEKVAKRTGLPEIRRLAVTFRRSERLGAPVSQQLRALARDVRAERTARQQERARRAPVAMLFPLVFLILPAFVLSAVVPAVLVAIGDVP